MCSQLSISLNAVIAEFAARHFYCDEEGGNDFVNVTTKNRN
jgi:hypothetical protein